MPAPKAVPAPTPRHVVAGDTFIWRSDDPDVGEVRIPLKFKGKYLIAILGILAAGEDNSDALMAHYLMSNVWPEDVRAQAGEADQGELMAMYNAWQVVVQDRQGASFPQS